MDRQLAKHMECKVKRHSIEDWKRRSARDKGFAFVELLLVVALVATVSSVALRGFERQRTVLMQNENQVSSIIARQAGEWVLVDQGDGGRVWMRKI